MLFFFLKNVFISITIIILIHYIYDYFKSSLTVPKIKDLVNKPDIQYKEILESIKESEKMNIVNNKKEKEKDKKNMKNELKNYITQLNNLDDNIPLGHDSGDLFQSF